MELKTRTTKGAEVEQTLAGWRLSIPAGEAGQYRLAQLDNCSHIPRREFPYRSLDLKLRARVSSNSVRGTWGFGVWNDPYRLSLGRGENLLHVFTLPNAAWFFHSSPESCLSFRDDTPRHGFFAQTFRSRGFPIFPLLGAAGAFIFSRAAARRKLSRLIEEETVALDLDMTQWHSYGINWSRDLVVFDVDGSITLETEASPHPPLGAVIWIDNQFASFTPEGKVASGTLANPAAWLEIDAPELKA